MTLDSTREPFDFGPEEGGKAPAKTAGEYARARSLLRDETWQEFERELLESQGRLITGILDSLRGGDADRARMILQQHDAEIGVIHMANDRAGIDFGIHHCIKPFHNERPEKD